MFIGHFALAFAAKRVAPTISLGTLVLAAQLADLVWPVLLLAGIERVEIRPGATAVTPLEFVHYPYSHSLLALLGWGAGVGLAYMLARRSGAWLGVVLAALVLSHWLLDLVAHRPDLPLTPWGAQRLGFGLWHSLPATLVLEAALFACGVALYLDVTRPLDRTGRWACWALVAFLAVTYAGNLFGPPPPSASAVAWAGLAMWLLVAWAYWIDGHRRAAPSDCVILSP
jgi:hypothetical protein